MAGRRGFSVSFTAVRANVRLAPNKRIARLIDKHTEHLVQQFIVNTKYPPPPVPADSRYTRSYNLFLSWRMRRTSHGTNISYEASNNAKDYRGRPYARLVYGPTGQWGPHAAHGWPTITELIRRSRLRERIRDETQMIINLNLESRGNV